MKRYVYLLSCHMVALALALSALADSEIVFSTDSRYGQKTHVSTPFEFDDVRSPAAVDIKYVAKGAVGLVLRWEVLDKAGKVVRTVPVDTPLHVPAAEKFGKGMRHVAATPWIRLAVPGAKSARLRASAYGISGKAASSNDVLVVSSLKAGWQDGPVSDAFANWYALGEDVVFRARPDGCVLRGVVADTAGREVFHADAKDGVWRWRPGKAGFYSVRFARVAADGSARTVSAELGCANYATQDGRVRLTEAAAFPRDVQHVAVSPCPPRDPKDVPPKFGYNIQPPSTDYDSLVDFKAIIREQLDYVRLLGMCGHLRLHAFRWSEIEAAGRGKYDWRKPDDTFQVLQERGYGFDRFMVNTWSTPDWLARLPSDAAKYPRFRLGGFCPKEWSAWGDYIEAFVKRYPQMKFLEIWDEPHLPGQSIFWMDATPEEFVELLKTAYIRAKAVNPSLKINMGGISMRYAAFYREFVKAGGVQWYDTMGTHCGYDMRAMRAIEDEYGAPHKPYREDEWHTVLYNASNKNPPGEEECAYRMLVNFADLLHIDRSHVTGFGIACGNLTPESAAFSAKAGGIRQIYGMFRSLPWVEPRFAAYALRTAVDLFSGNIRDGGAWRMGEDGRQYAVLMRHDKGTVAFVFCGNPSMKVGAVAPEILAAARGRRVLDWEGHDADLGKMKPRRMYYILDPDESELKKGEPVEVLDYQMYNFKAKAEYVRGGYAVGGSVTNALGGGASFSLSPSASGLDFTFVIPSASKPPEMRVAIDCVGKGYLEDVVEFSVGADGKIVKPRTPEINGDLPAEYSFAGTVLTRTTVEWKAARGGLVGRLHLASGDLYPFIYDAGRTIRLSLSATDGRKRLSWGGGLGKFTDASAFGALTPRGGPRAAR